MFDPNRDRPERLADPGGFGLVPPRPRPVVVDDPDRVRDVRHEGVGVQSDANRARSLRNVSSIDSGSTRVSPTTVVKFVSPFQRGTTCQCRWSGMPAPATRPRFIPTL